MLLTYISNCDISKLDIGGANGFEIKEGLRPNVGDSLLYTVLPARASARIRHRQEVKAMTKGEVSISPGTMYGILSKMEKDGLIRFVSEAEKRKIYEITELGREILTTEMNRIKRIYINSIGDEYNG